jgi:hypothetical protein
VTRAGATARDGDAVEADDRDRPACDGDSLTPTRRRAALRALATHGGEVVVAERRRALRALDDGTGVPPEVRRVISTMAVRIVTDLLRRPAAAIAAGDDPVAAAAVRAFAPTER